MVEIMAMLQVFFLWCTKTKYHLACSLTIATLFVYGTLVYCLPKADMLSSVSVQTETVSFKVADGTRAAFYVSRMRVSDSECLEGLITPALGATLTYGRIGRDPLSIEIRANMNADGAQAIAATYVPSDGGSQLLTADVYLEYDKHCQGSAALLRLPIWGQLRIGQEFRPPATPMRPQPTFLLKGKLDIAARTVGPSFLSGSTLYPLTQLTIPVGSRLETYPGREPEAAVPFWWGLASVEPDGEALMVEAATEARRLALYRPGQSMADLLEISLLTQVTNDPGIVRLQVIFAAIIVLISLSLQLADPLHFFVDEYRRQAIKFGKRS